MTVLPFRPYQKSEQAVIQKRIADEWARFMKKQFGAQMDMKIQIETILPSTSIAFEKTRAAYGMAKDQPLAIVSLSASCPEALARLAGFKSHPALFAQSSLWTQTACRLSEKFLEAMIPHLPSAQWQSPFEGKLPKHSFIGGVKITLCHSEGEIAYFLHPRLSALLLEQRPPQTTVKESYKDLKQSLKNERIEVDLSIEDITLSVADFHQLQPGVFLKTPHSIHEPVYVSLSNGALIGHAFLGKLDPIKRPTDLKNPQSNLEKLMKPTETSIHPAELQALDPASESTQKLFSDHSYDIIKNVNISLHVKLGSATLTIDELFSLKEGSTVKLNELVDEDIELFHDQQRIGKGKLMIIDDHFGICITDIVNVK